MSQTRRFRVAAPFLAAAALLVASCSTAKVDLQEPRHVVGSEENVKVNAQIFAERVSANEIVTVAWEIENGRADAIAFADLAPHTTYDTDSRTVTIVLGSEVPGNEVVPRLQKIASGERRSFSMGARMPAFQTMNSALAPVPRYLQIRVYFLGETEPFESLVGIPERAVKDSRLANDLFPQWVENTESVLTNAVPITWAAPMTMQEPASTGRRRGRG